MIQVQETDLIEGEIYYIGSYGPDGLIKKMKGVYGIQYDLPSLLRFDNVIQYKHGEQRMIDWFLVPAILSSNEKSNYYWKYFIPSNMELKSKVTRMDTDILLTKMLLLRKEYSKRIGCSSTIRGMIHHRFGLR